MPISAIDLFCGIGGLTKGLNLSGINVVAGIDIEESCKYIYESNNKNTKFILKDITKIDHKYINSLFTKNTTRVLAGCAPCQPFSNYTNRYRKDGYRDDKWRLLYYFAEIIKHIQPEIIAMENVPQLQNQKVYLDFINTLKSLNYNVFTNTVYCPDYGVPQKRKRLVLLASKLGKIKLIDPLYDPEHYLTVRDAIQNLPHINAGETCIDDPIHTSSSLTPLNLKRIRASKQNGSWRDWPINLQLTCHKKATGKSFPSVYGRMCWDEPSPTITTQFYGYGNGRFGHPEQDRAISIREGALLQSFPSDYIFLEQGKQFNKRILGTQIGNAVPVKLGEAIGVSILNHLKEINNEKSNI